MRYKEACELLELDNDVSIQNIKKQYRLKALLYHPDKNPSEDASSKFQEISEAYHYLLDHEGNNDDDESDEILSNMDYKYYLFMFLKNTIKGNTQESLLYAVLKKITTLCSEKAIQLLQNLEKPSLIKIYEILKKNKHYLHIESDLLDKIEELISSKIENDECVILQPHIDDLLENNLYKLTVNQHVYIVPLWHNNLVYDNSGNDIYVKCFPILDDKIEIDKQNNIHIQHVTTMNSIWESKELYIELGKRKIEIPIEQIKLKTKQVICLKNIGISQINTNNIYDISNKANIYVYLNIS
jgi:hypothetical protein|tara:strand:- start:1485 stop:2378 length:894 start_codon:yes stop_codon:yes gene_type:complete